MITRALYDTMFQYEEGDLQRPSYAAGTAVQVILRMFGCAKGAALWEMQAGMGEVVVAPLYQLLKSRGVDFRFFREVKQLAWMRRARASTQIRTAGAGRYRRRRVPADLRARRASTAGRPSLSGTS